MKTGCVLKAAGKSRRFGRNKLLEDLNGKPVLAYVLDAVTKCRFEKIVAVTSCPKVDELCRSYHIDTVMYEGGPVSMSIRLGLGEMLNLDGCMFVSGDQPLCSIKSYNSLIDEFEKKPEQVYRLCFGSVPGSPVLFPKRLFPQLMALEGELGGMSVADKKKVCPVMAGFEYELFDADTEVQLKRIRDCMLTLL